ncbi:MAG TPA: translation initiation factor IF-2 associated domain-containing protein, partial [Nitrosospira sp.]|nr:translation initiation factor IF-2 associated domain-containing protein [Nitrosospira sp.]
MNVEQFASELGVLPTVLLEQLRAAGVSKNLTEDSLTEKDKTQLLEYLRTIHGTREEKSKISLPRRQTSEIKKSDSSGKARSIQVEVRKKRVIVKGDLGERPAAGIKPAEAVSSAPAIAVSVPTPVIDAAQQALREEEARRQAELIARQTAEL